MTFIATAVTEFVILTTADELEVLKGYSEFAAFFSVLRLPLIIAETAFDENGLALSKVLGDDFGLPAKAVNIDESSFFTFFTRLGFVASAGGDANFTDVSATGSHPQLGVASEVSHEDNFIIGGHEKGRY